MWIVRPSRTHPSSCVYNRVCKRSSWSMAQQIDALWQISPGFALHHKVLCWLYDKPANGGKVYIEVIGCYNLNNKHMFYNLLAIWQAIFINAAAQFYRFQFLASGHPRTFIEYGYGLRLWLLSLREACAKYPNGQLRSGATDHGWMINVSNNGIAELELVLFARF